MYPRSLFLLPVDQHDPDGLTGSSKRSRGTGPQVHLKHEFSHPQNTWPFSLCSDMFRVILQSKLKASSERRMCFCVLAEWRLIMVTERSQRAATNVSYISLLERSTGQRSGLLPGEQPDTEALSSETLPPLSVLI